MAHSATAGVETEASAYGRMDEVTLKQQFAECPVTVLATTSTEKRRTLLTMANALGLNDEHDTPQAPRQIGLRAITTDTGSVKIVPTRTPEADGSIENHSWEKASNLLATLLKEGQLDSIRQQLAGNGFDAENINILGMTEDSGFSIMLANNAQKREFLTTVIDLVKDRIDPAVGDYLIKNLEKQRDAEDKDSGFPGADLHPLQEQLGGFDAMMQIVYDAADIAGITHDTMKLHYTSNIGIVSPGLRQIFTREYTADCRLQSREEYEHKKASLPLHQALNSDCITIFPGQKNGQEKTFDELLEEGVLTRSSKDLPVDYPRRQAFEFLQDLTKDLPPLNPVMEPDTAAARITPSSLGTADPSRLDFGGGDKRFTSVHIPSAQHLADVSPDARPFGVADVLILAPDDDTPSRPVETTDNYRLLIDAALTVDTNAASMGKRLVVDNTTGKFSRALEVLKHGYIDGRLMGSFPFFVANDRHDLERHLSELHYITSRTPKIRTLHAEEYVHGNGTEPEAIPNDGIFSVFIAGGHNNSNKQDLEEARALGRLCAKNGYRIVSGGGAIEGSMGAAYTGFIQYHIEQLGNVRDALETLSSHFQKSSSYDKFAAKNQDIIQTLRNAGLTGFLANINWDSKINENVQRTIKEKLGELTKFQHQITRLENTPDYSTEKIIHENPALLDTIADAGFIPRDRFYAYSTQDLLKLESPNGAQPPATTYFDAKNLPRRLKYLTMAGTTLITPGGIGTDQELRQVLDKHMDARLRPTYGVANDAAFADGTRDNEGAIIIYNREGMFTPMLELYGLQGESYSARFNREKLEAHGVFIVNSAQELHEALTARAMQWIGDRGPASSQGRT